MSTQQLNDLLYKAFTVDGNGNIALRMTLQTGTVQSWKDPVASLANLPPSGNTSGDVRMTMDTGLLYRWNGTAWVQANAYSSGQGISISGQTVAIDLDANSGLQFISGKLALKADGTTTEISSGSLRVKPGVFASLVHTHISSDITDWTTALNTWLATKTTANITENTNLYFTQARVLATPLTGLSLATGTAIVATDTELVAFGKLQKQISDEVTARSNAVATKENTITAGTTAQYWRGDKSWQTLNTTAVAEGTNLYYTNSRGIGSVLTGLSLATSTDIVATDSILTAMGKLQAQNTAQGTAIGLRALDSGVVHIAGTETIIDEKTFVKNASTAKTNFGASKDSNGSYQTLAQIEVGYSAGGWGDGYLGINAPSTTPYSTAPARALTINSASNVGIGTTAPTEKLHVTGNIYQTASTNTLHYIDRISSGDGARVMFRTGGADKWGVGQHPFFSTDFCIMSEVTANAILRLTEGNDLLVNSQNWTSAWTSYTPTAVGDSGSGATINVLSAKYKIMGRTMFFKIRASLTAKGTCAGSFYITQPSLSQWVDNQAIAGGLYPQLSATSRGFAIAFNQVFGFTKQSGNALVNWTDVAVNDEIIISGVLEI